jgi:hypothetical protein
VFILNVIANSPFFGKENNYSELTFGLRRKGKRTTENESVNT